MPSKKCTHEWMFIESVSKWISESQKEEAQSRMTRVIEAHDQAFERASKWWSGIPNVSGMIAVNNMTMLLTEAAKDHGKRYQCINCEEVRDLYGKK